MWRDVVKRPFIAAGFVGFVLMVPLALTSNAYSMRRLGRKWHQLHKLIYLVAPAGIIHYWWHKAGKNDLFEPFVYGAIVFLLLALRVYWSRTKAMKKQGSRNRGKTKKTASVRPTVPAVNPAAPVRR
jgi:sulfoxide reductase heme-binding subunit YedZ